jgi:hypothetical protein
LDGFLFPLVLHKVQALNLLRVSHFSVLIEKKGYYRPGIQAVSHLSGKQSWGYVRTLAETEHAGDQISRALLTVIAMGI